MAFKASAFAHPMDSWQTASRSVSRGSRPNQTKLLFVNINRGNWPHRWIAGSNSEALFWTFLVELARSMSLKGKKALVAGADGFVGSRLTEALVEEGAGIVALCPTARRKSGPMRWR